MKKFLMTELSKSNIYVITIYVYGYKKISNYEQKKEYYTINMSNRLILHNNSKQVHE